MSVELARAIAARRNLIGPEPAGPTPSTGGDAGESTPALAAPDAVVVGDAPSDTDPSDTDIGTDIGPDTGPDTTDPPKPTVRPKRRRATKGAAATSDGAAESTGAESTGAESTGASPSAEPRPAPPRSTRPRADQTRPTEARVSEPRRSRRRFSLPPLDEDHERVSRSIESFLGGIDPTPDDPTAAGPTATPDGATTVAIVAVDGLPDAGALGAITGIGIGHGHSGPADAESLGDALAMVERTLRGAARGSDVVTIVDRGRFRVVLASTGELAARAYLRRIRAAIEPRLEASALPLRLAVATATVLDEPVEDAVQRAEHRLSMALAAARSSLAAARSSRAAARADHDADDGDDDNEESAPRAAAD